MINGSSTDKDKPPRNRVENTKDLPANRAEIKKEPIIPGSVIQIKADPRDRLFKPEGKPLIISSSPYFHTTADVPRIMWTVIAALMPAAGMAVYYFGMRALILIGVCIAAALISEILLNKLKGESLTITDGSAAITGLLLALTLPPSLSWGYGILGASFAIIIGKQIFGGLGYNIFNPALLGRAFLQVSFPVDMTTWTFPQTEKFAQLDAVTAATPLGIFKFDKTVAELNDLFIGNIGGSLGETCALAILIGGLLLLILKYADWRIPLSYLGTVVIIAAIFHASDPGQYAPPLFHLLAGGLMLGAFFMATDMVTSPITPLGSWIFGIGCGLVLMIIRLFGGIPEGVMYSILIMNALTPLINRYTRPKIFGEQPS